MATSSLPGTARKKAPAMYGTQTGDVGSVGAADPLAEHTSAPGEMPTTPAGGSGRVVRLRTKGMPRPGGHHPHNRRTT